MQLSVVIPNLHSPVIHQTLAALAQQTWPLADTEIIVVGLDRYGHVARFPFARHLNTDHPVGPATARNLGIRATSGEIVIFLDADGIPCHDWLARLARWFNDPRVAVVGGGVAFAWDEPYWTVCDNVSNVYRFVASAPAGERPHLTSFNLAVRRTVLQQVGLFDERSFPKASGEDTDLALRLRLAGHRLHFDPQAVVTHQQSRTTLRAVLHKAWNVGYYSCRIDARYAAHLDFPRQLLDPGLLRLASPFLASAVTLNIYRHNPELRRRWVWLGVYLAKLAWCWGAAQRLTDNHLARPVPASTTS